MAAALITASTLALFGLVASLVSGHTARGAEALAQHVSLAVFVTLVTLLAHSMTLFYLIGKGRAVREALAEAGLPTSYAGQFAAIRRRVFGLAMAAIAATMATSIVGGGVDTGALPAALHGALAYLAVALQAAALGAEIRALVAGARVVQHVDDLLERAGR